MKKTKRKITIKRVSKKFSRRVTLARKDLRRLFQPMNPIEKQLLFIIGCHETLPLESGVLHPLTECQYVYRKK